MFGTIKKILAILISILILVSVGNTQGKKTGSKKIDKPDDFLTISYTIQLNSLTKSSVAELYNGGVQTFFSNGKKLRLRLVTLARIQSLFVTPGKNKLPPVVTFIKESGDKYKFMLNQKEWAGYMKIYDSLNIKLLEDTITVLGYLCKKAVLTTLQGQAITAYYTKQINNIGFKIAYPIFKQLPGTVLKYSVEDKNFSLSFNATEVTLKPIDKSVFFIPVTGYTVKKYVQGSSAVDISELLKEEPEGEEEPEEK